MKKIFQKNGIVLILVSLILLNTLPQIICAFMVYKANYFITTGDQTTATMISYIVSYIIFVLGLSNFLDNNDKVKNLGKGFPIAISYVIIVIINSITSNNGLDNTLWISIIHLIVDSLLTTLGLIITLSNITNKKIDLNIFKLIILVIVGLIIHIIPELICGLFMSINMNNLFIKSLLNGVLYGTILWFLIIIYISFIEKRLTKEVDKPINDLIIIGIALFLIAVTIFIKPTENNNVNKIDSMISYSLASGDYAFDEMEILTAKSLYNEAKEFKCAYEYAIDNTIDTRSCSGDLIDLFKTLNTEEAVEVLKIKINNRNANYYDLEALMKLMQDKKDKDINKVTKYLISNMYFTRNTVLPFDLTEKDKTELKEKLAKYDKHILVRRYIEIYEEWLNQGEFNNTVLAVASKLAREYPEEISLQAAAMNFYVSAPNNLTGDRTVVDNFVKLTKDEILKKSDEEIINYKKYVVIAYQRCNANDKVISFLEEFKPDLLSEDLGSLLLVSYKKSYKHEQAKEMAYKLLKMNSYNVDALSYLAINSLQFDLDESIEYAKKLSTVIREKKDNYLEADMTLGVYRTYLTGYYESPDSTFCPYHNFYSDMTEDEQQELKNDDIINLYLVGRGLVEENLPVINNIIEKYDYITYAYYYRAVYEMKNNQYESAVKDLEKAIELGNNDPFFYSELGFAYEGVGNLQKSLEAFEIASAKVDEYGLGGLTYNYNNIHNYFNVYINNAKHAMYESEGDHDE